MTAASTLLEPKSIELLPYLNLPILKWQQNPHSNFYNQTLNLKMFKKQLSLGNLNITKMVLLNRQDH
jgi:hypothetical protein